MKSEDTLPEFDTLWRSLPQHPGRARPIADIGRRRRAQQVYLAAELTIALLGIAVGGFLILEGSLAIGLAAVVYSLFGGALGWWTRGGNIDALSTSVAEHLAGSTAMLRARRNHNAAGVALLLAAFVFFGYVRFAQSAALSGGDAVIGLALAGMLALYLRRAFSAQRNLVHHVARVTSIDAESGDPD